MARSRYMIRREGGGWRMIPMGLKSSSYYETQIKQAKEAGHTPNIKKYTPSGGQTTPSVTLSGDKQPKRPQDYRKHKPDIAPQPPKKKKEIRGKY